MEKNGDNTTVEAVTPTGDDLKVFVKSVQGRRKTMEDRYLVLQDLPSPAQEFEMQTILAVFDGHGGSDTAQFCHDNFQSIFIRALASHSSSKVQSDSTIESITNQSGDSVHTRPKSTERSSLISECLRETFLALDETFAQQFPKSHCGSTALVVVIDRNRTKLDFANVGDSAVTVLRASPDNEVVLLNDIHNTENTNEEQRITELGGFLFAVSGTTKRVNGSLTITRAIGDIAFKKFVIAEPETECYDVDSRDQYVLLASDGFYDAIPFQDLSHVFSQVISSQQAHEQGANLAELLCEEALRRNNADNITVICAALK